MPTSSFALPGQASYFLLINQLYLQHTKQNPTSTPSMLAWLLVVVFVLFCFVLFTSSVGSHVGETSWGWSFCLTIPGDIHYSKLPFPLTLITFPYLLLQ